MIKHSDKNIYFGIISMLIHSLAIAVLYGIIKELRNELSSNLIVFLFKFALLIAIIPYSFKGGIKQLKTKKIGLHILRGFLSVAGSLTLFYAVKFIDLVDATAVGYLEQVLWALMGMFFFAESVNIHKIIAALISFLGAILVVYPDIVIYEQGSLSVIFTNINFKGLNHYYIFVLMSIIFWAGNCAVVKVLGKTETNKAQLFYVMLMTTIFAAPLAFFDWQPLYTESYISLPHRVYDFDEHGLKSSHIISILLLAFCYYAHNVGFFKALQHADLSIVIPYDYSRLIFTGIIGYVFFSEYPEFGSIVGYAFIFFAGLYLIKVENHKTNKKINKSELNAEFDNA